MATGYQGDADALKYYDKGGPGDPIQNPRNPMQGNLLARQLAQAKDFARNFGANSDSLYGYAAQAGRSQLNDTNRDIKNNFNARGLLQSGGRMGAEAGARSELASQLAGKRQQINSGLLGQLQGMEQNAFSTAAGLASPGAKTAGSFLKNAENMLSLQGEDAKLAGDAYAGVAQGVGSGLGTLANSIRRNQQDQGGGYGSPAAYNTYGVY